MFKVIRLTPCLHPQATPTKIFTINDMDYININQHSQLTHATHKPHQHKLINPKP